MEKKRVTPIQMKSCYQGNSIRKQVTVKKIPKKEEVEEIQNSEVKALQWTRGPFAPGGITALPTPSYKELFLGSLFYETSSCLWGSVCTSFPKDKYLMLPIHFHPAPDYIACIFYSIIYCGLKNSHILEKSHCTLSVVKSYATRCLGNRRTSSRFLGNYSLKRWNIQYKFSWKFKDRTWSFGQI